MVEIVKNITFYDVWLFKCVYFSFKKITFRSVKVILNYIHIFYF